MLAKTTGLKYFFSKQQNRDLLMQLSKNILLIVTVISSPALCMEAPPLAKDKTGKKEVPLWDVASMFSLSALEARQQTLETHLKVLETLKETFAFPKDVIDAEITKRNS